MASLHTLAFEIGTEEIPAFDLHKATAQLEKLVPEALDAVRIPHGAVSVHTTPRRLIVLAEDVADETEALQEVFRGPSAKIAFDAEGKPTKAAIGFARGKGLDVDALERREENGVEYVFAERSVPARDVAELLPGVLEGVITGISWPKSCRWGTRGEYFSRPVRWLVALSLIHISCSWRCAPSCRRSGAMWGSQGARASCARSSCSCSASAARCAARTRHRTRSACGRATCRSPSRRPTWT